MTEQASQAKTGAPRWTYIVGTLVALGGLAWGIVSFFMVRTTPSAVLPAQRAEANSGTAINASGNARVSVGAMAETLAAKQGADNSTQSAQDGSHVQHASAVAGGRAINASDDAEVNIESSANRKP